MDRLSAVPRVYPHLIYKLVLGKKIMCLAYRHEGMHRRL